MFSGPRASTRYILSLNSLPLVGRVREVEKSNVCRRSPSPNPSHEGRGILSNSLYPLNIYEFRRLTSLYVLHASNKMRRTDQQKCQTQNWPYYNRENFDFKYYLLRPPFCRLQERSSPDAAAGIPNILNHMVFCSCFIWKSLD